MVCGVKAPDPVRGDAGMILSRRDLQGIAADVLRDYDRETHRTATARIDPTAVAEKTLGLNISHKHLSLDGLTLGMTSMMSLDVSVWEGTSRERFHLDGRTILIDSDLFREEYGSGRYNYTVAHEVGHQIMYMTFPYEYDPLVLRRLTTAHLRRTENGYRVTDWNEWYADTLASYILMPDQLVWDCLERFSLPKHIRSLNDPYPYNQQYRFSQMAKHMGVSKHALSIRLQQMGVLLNPYTQRTYTRPIDIDVEEDFLI